MSCKSLLKHSFANDAGTEIITIGVGVADKRQTFRIRKAVLQRCTRYFDKGFESETGKKGLMFLNDEDPSTFEMFSDWLGNGQVTKAPTKNIIRARPSAFEVQMLEGDLLHRFNNHMLKLVNLYILAEKYAIEHLKNQAIDAIQDGYNEYGTVFGPGLICKIFTETKKGSTLRDLCIAANIIHIDRGCSKLRTEVMTASMMLPDFMPHMLKWVSRNFIMFGRRHREGFNVLRSMEGFSMLNRAKLCPCHFHEHSPGQAHEGHEGCAVPFLDCSHGEEGEGMEGVA